MLHLAQFSHLTFDECHFEKLASRYYHLANQLAGGESMRISISRDPKLVRHGSGRKLSEKIGKVSGISRDPKLVRHDSGRKLSEQNRKNIGYKPRPSFLNKMLLERSFNIIDPLAVFLERQVGSLFQ